MVEGEVQVYLTTLMLTFLCFELGDSSFEVVMNVWLKMLKHNSVKNESFTFKTMSEELSFNSEAASMSTFDLFRAKDFF